MLLLDSSPTLQVKSQVVAGGVARSSMVSKPPGGVATRPNKMPKSRSIMRHASMKVIYKKKKLQTLEEENLESQSYGDKMSRVGLFVIFVFKDTSYHSVHELRKQKVTCM